MSITKVACFAHTLNIAAQKLYGVPAIARWAGRIWAMVLWLKRSGLAKPVLKEKQRLLGLPEHGVILDVKNRWNSLFLMVERFVEQFPALQAASVDPRLKRSMERDRLERLSADDLAKAEQFVRVMRVLYTSTICISAEKSSTLGQILPILGKLQHHFTVTAQDSAFTQAIKEKIWGDLSQRYQVGSSIMQDSGVAAQQMELTADDDRGEDSSSDDDTMVRNLGLSALGELFADEDMAVETRQETPQTIAEKVQEEIQRYRDLPSTLTSVNPPTRT
ncbi:zinc finger BED domain-containing protein 4-like [Engraulis encrasicolus]|uniref:zinc finger BED domain-containing protein 4-like n=1 Tax=Engraulis encrasicolus TaxID=184585 RepID=UPI002FD0111A